MIKSVGEMDFSIPALMGVLNVTPDSFFDGGNFQKKDRAIRHAVQMANDGATWIDIGGESTRPGAQEITVSEELDRVLPVVEAVANETEVYISIDTSKPEVMQEAIGLGATLINDVYALRKTNAKKIVCDEKVNVCLMHMYGEPRTMQQNYSYENVVKEVKEWLKKRVDECVAAGIETSKIMIDPGFAFGKSPKHNLQLVAQIKEFFDLGVPVLLGMSRKSTIGVVLNRELPDRLSGSLALAILAMLEGVHILRVHDVKETLDAIKMVHAVKNV